MKCSICGNCMQPETVVTVLRGVGRTRSVVKPGWHCWTCKASRSLLANRERLPMPGTRPRRRSAAVGGQLQTTVRPFGWAARWSWSGV